MKVLLIPEDFTYDQYILLPLFSRLFRDIGKPNAKISVCRDPNLGGVEEALKVERLREIVNSYRMMDLFILCVDRDGKKGRKMRLDQIENEFGASFLAENAWEEIETWLLAGLELPKEWRWGDVRAELQVRRTYFEPLARKRGVSDRPDGGRGALAREAVRNITAIRRKCTEDFGELARRIEASVGVSSQEPPAGHRRDSDSRRSPRRPPLRARIAPSAPVAARWLW